MNNGPHDITLEGLTALVLIYMEKRNWSVERRSGYLDAMRLAGWLRPGCPAWIRNSAGVYYALPPDEVAGQPGN